MSSNLEEIQNTIITIYNKNANFFKNSYPEIYDKILELEEKNSFTYNLEFINNHFELVKKDGSVVYNCDPYFDAEHRLKSLDNKSNFLLIKIDSKYDYKKSYDERIDPFLIINRYIEQIDGKNINVDKKLIFLGSILGLHISEIINKSAYEIFLLIEDNIEIFRLSMFLNDYEELGKNKKIFFCINEENKYNNFKDFLNYDFQYNNSIKFELASENEVYLVDETPNNLLLTNELNYPFSEYLISYIRGINYLKQGYKLLKLDTNYNILNEKKVLFLGGGLSLKENLEFIKKNQDKFLIVCVAAVLKTLEENSIYPDMIFSSDSSELINNQFDVDKKIYEKSLIFVSNKTDEKVLKKLSIKNTFLFNDSLEVFNNTGVNTGVNIGNIAYSILLKLGANTIYLLGFDACVDKSSGKSHSTKDLKIDYKEFDLKIDSKIDSKTHLLKVKGNFEETVFTTLHFKGMIDCFDEIKDEYSVKSYNLSNGAYLPGIKPLKIENIELFENINKKEELENIKNQILKICKDGLTQEEENFLINEYKLLSTLNSLNMDNLYEEFNIIIKKNRKSILLQIIDKYFVLVLPYKTYLSKINKKKSQDFFENSFKNIILFIKEHLKEDIK